MAVIRFQHSRRNWRKLLADLLFERFWIRSGRRLTEQEKRARDAVRLNAKGKL